MRYKYYDRIMTLFVTVLLVSNIASSAKIVDWGVSYSIYRWLSMLVHCCSPSVTFLEISLLKYMAIVMDGV